MTHLTGHKDYSTPVAAFAAIMRFGVALACVAGMFQKQGEADDARQTVLKLQSTEQLEVAATGHGRYVDTALAECRKILEQPLATCAFDKISAYKTNEQIALGAMAIVTFGLGAAWARFAVPRTRSSRSPFGPSNT